MNIQQPSWRAQSLAWLLLLSAGSVLACSQAGSAWQTIQAGRLTFRAPAEWRMEPPASSLRLAQIVLPSAGGDAGDASLVVYYFGPGQGGSVDANLDRWINQMEQPDGSSSNEKARSQKMTVNGLNVTVLDVGGTYRGEIMPGSGLRHHSPNARLRAAVVETPEGNYFVKLIGPAETVNRWDEAFTRFIQSAQFK